MPVYPANAFGPISPSRASVRLTPLLPDGTPLASATGFIVSGNHGPTGMCLVTNRHVVTGRDQNSKKVLSSSGAVPDKLRIHHRSRHGPVERVETLFNDDNSSRWVEHDALGGEVDVVLMALEDLVGTTVAPYDLGNLFPDVPRDPGQELLVQTGDDLVVVGFPFGLEGPGGDAVWVRGMAATDPARAIDHLPRSLIDARTRKGMSGSPVLVHTSLVWRNRRGELVQAEHPLEALVGVYSGRINAESDLGYVWHTQVIRDLRDRGVRSTYGRYGVEL